MYKLVLILKYLRRKLAPLFAAAAVTLCTAMVIIVISVMGGFLEMMKSSVKQLTGQIVVHADIVGFADYEQLAEQLRALPEVDAVTPLVRVPGLLKLDGSVQPVEIVGIEPESYNVVTQFNNTHYWSDEHLQKELAERLEMLRELPADQRELVKKDHEKWFALLHAGKSMRAIKAFGDMPMIVPGIEVRAANKRNDDGEYMFFNSGVGSPATITVLPVSKTGNLGAFGPEVKRFIVANEFKSGLYEIDKNRVFVHFDVLQEMLKMQAMQVEERDYDTGEPTGKMIKEPGRTHELMVRSTLEDGEDLERLVEAVRQTVRAFQDKQKRPTLLQIETWRQRHRVLLDAVEKEKGLLTILFAIISIVAIFMVGVIFYMIVLEKTRDIGTLRAIGASRRGVAGIFIGYGLAIGIVGAVLGTALASVVVLNLNEIQAQLYEWFAFKMWDPRVYYFERIPSRIDAKETAAIAVAAIVSGLIGSIVPAILAARLKPVEALRYE